MKSSTETQISDATLFLPIRSGEHADWEKDSGHETNYENDLAFWTENLRGAPKILNLPADHPRPEIISHRSNKRRFSIGPVLTEKLRNLSAQERTTLCTVLAAALNTLLYRYSGQDDILIGIPVGSFADTLVLRTRLAANISFRELLRRVRLGLANIHSHSSIAFDEVLNALVSDDSPAFQVLFNWCDRNGQPPFIGLRGLAGERLLAHRSVSRCELTINLTEEMQDIVLDVDYSTDLFDGDRIERMVGHYRSLLGAIAAAPECSLAEIPLLTDAERHQILVEWNQTKIVYPTHHCVHQLFEEQARRAPQAVAVAAGEKQLTYYELNARANQLARYLKGFGVMPNKVVGICVERSLDMIIGLLGILKAGGAYLPLDPGNPKERLAFMLNDAGVEVLLTHQRLCHGLVNASQKVFCLDSDWPSIAEFSRENLKNEGCAEDLAYLIYTSGSTGTPKGVELTHSGLLNLVFWHRRNYQVRPSDRATQLAGVGFDASVWELWPYLASGASIHMPDEETRLLPDKLRDWLVEHKITLSFVPTPLAEAMVALPWPSDIALRVMLIGGDRLTRRPRLSLPFSLVNHYGPTENTVVTTCAIVGNELEGTRCPPIGRPIDNTQVYILDSHLQPVPVGVQGELHIGGLNLARGYHNRPELEAEKFITNPFSADPEERLYKTGDLASYSPNGMIHFLGRNDSQIKIRGFRIEVGEIESVLAEHPAIAAVAVIARDDGAEDKHLVAYVVLKIAGLTNNKLREFLKQKLPDYMIPFRFVALDGIPLTSNGKVDRAHLPPPDSANTLEDQDAVAPLTTIETTIAGILGSLLKLDNVDREANFFDLGGHSLLGTQLIARIRNSFGIDLPLRSIFDSPTVAALSAEIEQILVAEVEAMSEEEVQHSLNNLPN